MPRRGDTNMDTYVDSNDVPSFADALTGNNIDSRVLYAADMNGDGYADGRDIPGFVSAVIGG